MVNCYVTRHIRRVIHFNSASNSVFCVGWEMVRMFLMDIVEVPISGHGHVT